MAKFCHKNRKICHILPKTNYQILQIKLNNRITFFFPGDPEYNTDAKMHTKSHSGAYQKEERLKTSILYQNKSTKTYKDWKRGIQI